MGLHHFAGELFSNIELQGEGLRDTAKIVFESAEVLDLGRISDDGKHFHVLSEPDPMIGLVLPHDVNEVQQGLDFLIEIFEGCL